MLAAYLTFNLFCSYKVCRCRMRKKGLGATERLWAGWTPDEGWACYRALWLINSQLVPGQRRTREDWHRPGHHRTSTANGSTSRRCVAPASFLYGQHRAQKIPFLKEVQISISHSVTGELLFWAFCFRGKWLQIFVRGSHSLKFWVFARHVKKKNISIILCSPSALWLNVSEVPY